MRKPERDKKSLAKLPRRKNHRGNQPRLTVGRKLMGNLQMKLNPRNAWKAFVALLISALIQSTGWSQQAPNTKLNLLTNGDFKQGMTGWELLSFGKQGQATVVQPEAVMVDSLKPRAAGQPAPDSTEIHDGKPSIMINNMAPDDTSVKQKVTVKPATRYRLTGWVKTKNVEGKNMTAKKPTGAGLCLMGGFEGSASIVRTKGWTFLTYDFSSGTRTEIVVGARIGEYATPVKGTAWFSDISLVELGH